MLLYPFNEKWVTFPFCFFLTCLQLQLHCTSLCLRRTKALGERGVSVLCRAWCRACSRGSAHAYASWVTSHSRVSSSRSSEGTSTRRRKRNHAKAGNRASERISAVDVRSSHDHLRIKVRRDLDSDDLYPVSQYRCRAPPSPHRRLQS